MDQLLWWMSIGADALTLGALAGRGLHRRFPIFALYLLVNLTDDLILKLVPGPATRVYALTWMSSKPIILILWVLVVLELFRLVREHYPGMGSFARSLLFFVLATASIAAVLSLAPDVKGIDWHSPTFQLIVLLNRWVATVLAVFLFAMGGFLRYYKAPIKPNLLRHACILAGYFSVQATAMFLTNVSSNMPANASPFAGVLGADPVSQINRALFIGRIVCSLSWSILLTRTGEKLTQSPTLTAADLELIQRRDRELLETVRWLAK